MFDKPTPPSAPPVKGEAFGSSPDKGRLGGVEPV